MFIFFQFSNISSIRMCFSPNKIQGCFVRTFHKWIQYHNHQRQYDLEHLHSGKESTCQCRRPRFNLWFGRIPWDRKWQPTPVFLPKKFHGQRTLVGYSPWGCKESDTAQHACTHAIISTLVFTPGASASLSSSLFQSADLWVQTLKCCGGELFTWKRSEHASRGALHSSAWSAFWRPRENTVRTVRVVVTV